jgi:hypothetical protein
MISLYINHLFIYIHIYLHYFLIYFCIFNLFILNIHIKYLYITFLFYLMSKINLKFNIGDKFDKA